MGFHSGRPRLLGFGEDTLLAWRVRRDGTAAYAPDALVEHAVFRTSVGEALSRAWMAVAFPALVREVPELRRSVLFRHRVVLGQRSRVPVYALAAGLVGRRRGVVAGAALWWVAGVLREVRRQPASRAARLAGVPVVMATDAVVAAALVTGSVRARTVVV
jgi:hypothetical protein